MNRFQATATKTSKLIKSGAAAVYELHQAEPYLIWVIAFILSPPAFVLVLLHFDIL